jgi:hypothetical protein
MSAAHQSIDESRDRSRMTRPGFCASGSSSSYRGRRAPAPLADAAQPPRTTLTSSEPPANGQTNVLKFLTLRKPGLMAHSPPCRAP